MNVEKISYQDKAFKYTEVYTQGHFNVINVKRNVSLPVTCRGTLKRYTLAYSMSAGMGVDGTHLEIITGFAMKNNAGQTQYQEPLGQ